MTILSTRRLPRPHLRSASQIAVGYALAAGLYFLLVSILQSTCPPDSLSAQVLEWIRTWGLILLSAVALASLIRRRERILKYSTSSLRESVDLLEQLEHHTHCILLRLNQEHRITFINTHAQEIFGYNADELIGKDVYETLIPETNTYGEITRNSVRALLQQTQTKSVSENENITRDGRRLWISWSNTILYDELGMPSGMLCLGQDITERKQMEDALRKTEQMYRTVFESTGTATVLLEKDMSIALANSEALRLCGYSREEFEGSNLWKALVPEPDYSRMVDYHNKRRISPTLAPQSYECHIRDKRGNLHTLQATVSMIPGTTRSIASFNDITDRERMWKQVTQAKRMQSLGTLAAGVAHEINQPLTSLKLTASTLCYFLEQGKGKSEEDLKRSLQRINSEVDRVAEIIQHMRSLAHNHMDETPVPTDVAHCTKRALELMGAQLQSHDIRILQDIDTDVSTAQAFPLSMEQVILNLLTNSMQALDTAEQDEKIIHIKICQEEEDILLQVSDNGPGLGDTPDIIFDPFYTTQKTGEGMGIGLSLVHAFVTSWGGSLLAKNNENGGACIQIRLHPMK